MSLTPLLKRSLFVLTGLASLSLVGCGGTGGGSQKPDPVVVDHPIAYIKRPLPTQDVNGQTQLVNQDIRVTQVFEAGGDLYLRDRASPSAAERNITGAVTGGQGDVRDVSVSYDGTKLLFSLHLPMIDGAQPEDQPTWNIWEYDIAKNDLHRVITGDITAEAGQDRFPVYLPGVEGRIVFSSSRQRQARARLVDEGKDGYAAMEPSVNEAAMVLHVIDPATQEIQQISFNRSHDFAPSILNNGQIVYSRWDDADGRNAISLYRMNPDGTGLQLLYGVHSHATGSNGSQVEFMRPQQLADGRLLVQLMPPTGSFAGGDLSLIDVADYVENDQPTWANQGLSGPAQTPATVLDVSTASGPSAGGRFSSVFPLRDGSGRLLVSWSQCRLMENGAIVPCTAARLADPNAQEAPPLYGIFIYDSREGTQLPIVTPEEGTVYTDLVAVQARDLPVVIPDRVAGDDLDAQLVQDGVGVLHIQSVYDLDGADAASDSNGNPTSIQNLASATADQRPARFLRILKQITIPSRDVLRVPNTAYGRTRAFGMREVVGYAPIEADGSVRVRVPANVPLLFSVLDADGRRIGQPHPYALQFRPGEVVECHGCHDPASNLPHGRLDAAPPPALAGESMAKVAYANGRVPSLDLADSNGVSALYTDLSTPAPVSSSNCLNQWNGLCRAIIHYEQHIHPLWALPRTVLVNGVDTDVTCTGCHTDTDAAGMPRVPAGQLDLTDGPSTDEPAHFKAYRELLFPDNVQIVDVNDQDGDGDVTELVDQLVQATDAQGNPLFETDAQGNPVFQLDANGNPLLDANGNPIPIPVLVPVQVSPGPPMRAGSARGNPNSGYFLSKFDTGGSHEGYLTDAEKKLIGEWLDIGAQYYNNPFDVPVN